MNLDDLTRRIDELQGRLDQVGDPCGALPVAELLQELATALEELRTSEAELRQQAELVLEAHQATEVERRRYRDLFEFAPDAYMVTDLEGVIQEANHAAHALLGVPAFLLLNKPLAIFVATDDDLRAYHRWLTALRKAPHPRTGAFETRLRKRRGEVVEAELRAALVRDSQGHKVGLRWLIRDITQRKRDEREAAQRSRQVAALNAIVAAATRSLEAAEVLEALQEPLREYLGIPAGMVWLYRRANDRLDLAAHWGMPTRVDRARSLSATVIFRELGLDSQEPTYLPSLAATLASLGEDQEVLGPGLRSVLIIPLVANEQLQGMIALFMAEHDPSAEAQMAYYRVLGQQVAVAVQNARLYEEVRRSEAQLQELSRRLVDVQETERRSVAYELHEEMGGMLTALHLSLGEALRLAGGEAEPGLQRALDLTQDLTDRVRQLSLDLRPAMLDDLGLLPALVWYIERFSARTGVRTELKHSGLERPFLPEVATAAFRIVQEALTNVARHAHVQDAQVRLWASDESLLVQVEDHGDGFEVEAALRSPGHSGLSGMRNRASLLGGSLTVDSSSGSGTLVTAELPLSAPLLTPDA